MIDFARAVSRIFDPLFVFFALIIIDLMREARGWWIFAYVTGLFFVLFGVRLWMARRLNVDWDIRDRSKRIIPLILLLSIIFLNVFILNLDLLSFFAVWLLGFLLVTVKYKISGHVGVTTVASRMLFQWFGWWPVLFFIPLVCWARIIGKNHTIGQAFLGFLYSWFLLVVLDNWII